MGEAKAKKWALTLDVLLATGSMESHDAQCMTGRLQSAITMTFAKTGRAFHQALLGTGERSSTLALAHDAFQYPLVEVLPLSSPKNPPSLTI